jgi:hypothetical protein
LAIAGYVWWDDRRIEEANAESRQRYAAALRVFGLSSYWGLNVGMDESEVRYAKGEPHSIDAHGNWIYQYASHKYVVGWKVGQVVHSIQCTGPREGCERINGIGLGSSEFDIARALGGPPKPPRLDKSGAKIFVYGDDERNSLVLGLKQGLVMTIGVFGHAENGASDAK